MHLFTIYISANFLSPRFAADVMLIPNMVMIEPVSTPAINVINSISSYVVLIHENCSRVDQWRNNEGHYVCRANPSGYALFTN